MMVLIYPPLYKIIVIQGFSNLSEVGARGLLKLGKKHLGHQNWENLMQSKTGPPLKTY